GGRRVVSEWTRPECAPERMNEMPQALEADREARRGDRFAGAQSFGRDREAAVQQISMWRRARQLAEDAREMVRAHADGARQAAERVRRRVVAVEDLPREIDAARVPIELRRAAWTVASAAVERADEQLSRNRVDRERVGVPLQMRHEPAAPVR